MTWFASWFSPSAPASSPAQQASASFASLFQPSPDAPKTPAQSAEELAKAVQAAAKGTSAAPLVDPIATQATSAAKQVEDASKKSYFRMVLDSPVTHIAGGALLGAAAIGAWRKK